MSFHPYILYLCISPSFCLSISSLYPYVTSLHLSIIPSIHLSNPRVHLHYISSTLHSSHTHPSIHFLVHHSIPPSLPASIFPSFHTPMFTILLSNNHSILPSGHWSIYSFLFVCSSIKSISPSLQSCILLSLQLPCPIIPSHLPNLRQSLSSVHLFNHAFFYLFSVLLHYPTLLSLHHSIFSSLYLFIFVQ